MQEAVAAESFSSASRKQFKMSKSQRGFTLVELVIVLGVLALLLMVLSTGLFQSKEDAKVQSAQTQLLKDFPSAITRIVTMTNKCDNTSLTVQKLVDRGVNPNTVFGTPWTISTSGGNTVTVTYPLDLQDTTLATSMLSAIQAAPNVKSATGTTTQVAVTYRCN